MKETKIKEEIKPMVDLLSSLKKDGKIDFKLARGNVEKMYAISPYARKRLISRLDNLKKVYDYLKKHKKATRGEIVKDIEKKGLKRTNAYTCLYILEELELVERKKKDTPSKIQQLYYGLVGGEPVKRGRPPIYWKIKE